MSISETESHHVHGMETNPHNVTVRRFVRTLTEAHGGGNETSKHTTLALVEFLPGGGFDAHYREFNTETPVFDLVFYVISGRIRVTLGDVEESVGADTLVYCPSNVKQSMRVIGNRKAKMIIIYGTGEGERMGVPVYTKKGKIN